MSSGAAREEDNAGRLARLLRGPHPVVRIVTSEEQEARETVAEACLALDADFWTWDTIGGLSRGIVSGESAMQGTEGALAFFQKLSKLELRAVFAAFDAGAFLDDARVLRAFRNALPVLERTESHVVLIDHDDALPDVVKAHSTRFELTLPDAGETERIVRATVQRLMRSRQVTVKLTKAELGAAVKNLAGLTRRQIQRTITDVVLEDDAFTAEDLNRILAHKRQLLGGGSGALEPVESPASMDEVGGLDRLKGWLKQRARSFEPAAGEFGLCPPRGVLLLGVQGAGKSLCAKAIATAWQRPLVRLDAGALYDRYVGASEQRLRDALKQAEAMSPIVLWIDEIEKAFASAGSGNSNDGGLSKRMFGSLLTWMQEHTHPVFLVATANDIEALPPELMRKGRFDEIFFVDLPGTPARKKIAEVHLRKRGRDAKTFDLARIAAASEGYSGAEIEQGVISALHEAFASGRALDTDTVVRALEGSPPLSVTRREHLSELRAWARDRCVPAD
ncbi:MAG: AAA family ATPase [Phycisphaerales bacterium]|nr:MAG: AAA family ATPase [Phycisphaerales bacterium]